MKILAHSLRFIFSLFITTHSYTTYSDTLPPNSENRVKVGVILPLTGPFAREGRKIQEALKSLNATNLDFIFEDEACDPKKAVASYQKLSQFDGVKLFLGPWCGSPQHAIAPLLKSKDQIALLGSSASEELHTLSQGRMFSTQPSIEAESTFLAEQMNSAGIKSVAIIFQENNFSRAHEAAFLHYFKGKVLQTFAYTSNDVTDLKSIALRIKQLHPEALYIPDAFPLYSGFVKELYAIGIGSTPLYSVYSAQSEDVLHVLGAQGNGLKYSFPDCGDEDPAYYYAREAVQILSASVKTCGADQHCILESITKHPFDQHGMLKGNLILKQIAGQEFVKVGATPSASLQK